MNKYNSTIYYPFRGVLIEKGKRGEFISTTVVSPDSNITLKFIDAVGKFDIPVMSGFNEFDEDHKVEIEERYISRYNLTINNREFGEVGVIANNEKDKESKLFNFLYGPVPVMFDQMDDISETENNIL